jgi:FkbM family methyltransferase
MNLNYLLGRSAYAARDWVLARGWMPLNNWMPYDCCWPYDAARFAGTRDFRTIIDAGANVGQSATHLRGFFGNATIHSFEPIPSTFSKLAANTKGDSAIRAYPIALSDHSGTVGMIANDFSEASAVTTLVGDSVSTVRAMTLDDFASENGLGPIDLLKVDVEGHELAMLEGARGLISSRRIRAIYIEFGVDTADPQHTHFSKIHAALEPMGFVLAGIYDAYRSRPRYRICIANALYWNPGFQS